MELSPDLLMYILQFVDVKYFCSVSVVCKKWKELLDADNFWKMKYCYSSNRTIATGLELTFLQDQQVSSWKELYIKDFYKIIWVIMF